MAVGTRFVVNFPRRSRPRGLGYAGMNGVAGPLSGMGTWVVDTEYGLGPRFREGFNRPYPSEAMPTHYPRAQAARVLGPAAGVNVVARPYAATRLATTRMPVRMAPITAPGARLRNPGVAGYGIIGVPDRMMAFGMALKEPQFYMPTGIGAVAGLVGRFLPKGPVRMTASLGALGALGFGIYGFVRQWNAITKELATQGAAAVGAATVKGVMQNAAEVREDPQAASDAAKKGILAQYSCYENARRTDTWWNRLRGYARDALVDCGMTEAEAAILKDSFNKISRADRQRLGGAVYKPGGSLEDLG